jgi:hypothetical protein
MSSSDLLRRLLLSHEVEKNYKGEFEGVKCTQRSLKDELGIPHNDSVYTGFFTGEHQLTLKSVLATSYHSWETQSGENYPILHFFLTRLS